MLIINCLISSDLCFKKGDIILLRKKIDNNWYHGESGGKQGVFPLTYVQVCCNICIYIYLYVSVIPDMNSDATITIFFLQVITPLPSHIPQCKALYDFRMTNDDEEGCLTFNKVCGILPYCVLSCNWYAV
jgi:E3 ubiquitin-protein ligase SH3RF